MRETRASGKYKLCRLTKALPNFHRTPTTLRTAWHVEQIGPEISTSRHSSFLSRSYVSYIQPNPPTQNPKPTPSIPQRLSCPALQTRVFPVFKPPVQLPPQIHITVNRNQKTKQNKTSKDFWQELEHTFSITSS
jgi:hypothetical protein